MFIEDHWSTLALRVLFGDPYCHWNNAPTLIQKGTISYNSYKPNSVHGSIGGHGKVKFYDAFVDKESDWMIIAPRWSIPVIQRRSGTVVLGDVEGKIYRKPLCYKTIWKL